MYGNLDVRLKRFEYDVDSSLGLGVTIFQILMVFIVLGLVSFLNVMSKNLGDKAQK